jgi:hypothetical protein
MSDMIEKHSGKVVVLDLDAEYIVIGTLTSSDHGYYELENADVHDLRDARATREQYLAEVKHSGLKTNRRKVLIARGQVVGLALLDDVVG